MSDIVIETADRPDGVRVITINNAPVNAISAAFRTQMKAAVEAAGADDAVKAVVITGAGRAFIAGADIREFGKTPPAGTPTLTEMIHAIEDCPKTVVAAVNGAAAGGGLETALGCHWRVAAPRAMIGLPEVNLGTIPGATGTQRLPRVADIETALDMIVSGDLVPGTKAGAAGIVDAVADDTVEAAAAMALEKPVRKLREDDSKLKDIDAGAFDAYRKGMARRWRGFDARFRAVDAVENVVSMDYAAGIRAERDIFAERQETESARAMRHVFFSDREVLRHPSIPKGTEAIPITKAAVIGCGTMGGGIAMNFVNAGIPVTILEMTEEALIRGLGIIEKNYANTVSKGRLSQEKMDARLALLTGTQNYEDLGDADIVIEAVFETMDIKREVFGKLDEVMKDGAVLASNTSTLDIDEIAAATKRPEAVIGTHFFSPANVMRLLENVEGEKTSPEVKATVMKMGQQIGKVPVLVGVCDGFVGNRMLHHYIRQAKFLLEEGATPAQVDKVVFDFGFAMGPFAMSDLAGNDVSYLVSQEALKKYGPSNLRTSEIVNRLYEEGRYGQKTSKGYYLYEEGSRAPIPDPAVDAIIAGESKRLGIERREVSDEEILERCMFALVNEGAKILDEGIAARPLDIDLIYIYGYSFPRYRGGPMHWADEIGLDHVLARIESYWKERDPDHYEPAPLLRRLAGEGKTFKQWSDERAA